MSILLLLGLIMFVGLVVVHELGHFIVARRNGVEAEEFGIGFPPQAYKRRIKSDKGDFDFTLNWLPLGGFVRLKGESDDAKGKGTFGAAPLWVKVKIMIAGVLMNLITAIVLFTAVAWMGMPRFPEQLVPAQFTVAGDETVIKEAVFESEVVIVEVVENSPAAEAGLQPDDRILKINGQAVNTGPDVADATRDRAEQEVEVVVLRQADDRDDQADPALTEAFKIPVTVILNDSETAAEQGYLGVITSTEVVESEIGIVRYGWSAPVVAVGTVANYTKLTFEALGQAIKGLFTYVGSFFTGNQQARDQGSREATGQLTGPLGIFFTLAAVSQEGFSVLLFVIALISLALAIMNILPIPALDGGRLFVTLLYRVRKKTLTKEIEERIHATGFIALMVLFVLITIVDIRRFF